MDKYDSFEIFMIDVIKQANSISNLNDLFDVKYDKLISYLEILIRHGWKLFIAVCALLVLGPIVFGFTLGSFLLTPIGLIIAGVLGVTAANIIRHMYRNKELPLAIKSVGYKYEIKWKAANHDKEKIDQLFKGAVNDLLHSGKHSLSSYALHLLSQYMGNE